ncbi:MAG: hypothetical protein KY475_27550 [Planctomycetes bacterium]|nr:hypothetical protein [Planctomycetota bacterium]
MRSVFFLTLVFFGVVAPAFAQRGDLPGKRNFAAKPAVGEMLPDVAVYDAAGKEFPLRSLRGKHAVLVFGCLT